ncbi:hypothetical protein GT354_05415, partial [Streptomyces sp. SID3343]|nr:hypothetical protein [Streptomyces sp. SID3343]
AVVVALVVRRRRRNASGPGAEPAALADVGGAKDSEHPGETAAAEAQPAG